MKIGLALSGGGAKGAAHIGVLQALKEENIKIESISGTSSGSIVASLYVAGYTPYEILDIFKNNCKKVTSFNLKFPIKLMSDLINPNSRISGIVNSNNLKNALNMFFSNKNVFNISCLKMPIMIVAADANSGRSIYFTNKVIKDYEKIKDKSIYMYNSDITTAIMSSCAFPGFFEPLMYKNYMMIDGGLKENIPTKALKLIDDENKILSVSFINDPIRNVKDGSIISLLSKCFEIMGNDMSQESINLSDYNLNINLPNVNLLDCNNMIDIANAGYYTAKENINDIKKALEY